MSYKTEIFTQPVIRQAAEALDLLMSAQNHKLPRDSKKHVAVADIMRKAAARFQDLWVKQGNMSADEFYRKSLERMNVVRAERAELAKMRREKREADAAARAEMQAELAAIAA